MTDLEFQRLSVIAVTPLDLHLAHIGLFRQGLIAPGRNDRGKFYLTQAGRKVLLERVDALVLPE